MSQRIGDTIIISEEPDSTCELCGVKEETRPYGPGGKRICFACGEKDSIGTDTRLGVILFGETEEEAREFAIKRFNKREIK